jgi:DNA-binding NtrC family response regulator
MTDHEVIDVPDLPALMRCGPPRTTNVTRRLDEMEKEYINAVLASVGGNKTKAASILGIDRKTLRKKLDSPDFR